MVQNLERSLTIVRDEFIPPMGVFELAICGSGWQCEFELCGLGPFFMPKFLQNWPNFANFRKKNRLVTCEPICGWRVYVGQPICVQKCELSSSNPSLVTIFHWNVWRIGGNWFDSIGCWSANSGWFETKKIGNLQLCNSFLLHNFLISSRS